MKRLLALSLFVPSLSAATFTWDGSGTNDLTDTDSNWVGNVAPAHGGVTGSAGSEWIFAGTVRTEPLLADDVRLETLAFNSSQFFRLKGSHTITLGSTIRNVGAAEAEIEGDISVNGGSGLLEASGANLSFSYLGSVSTGNRDLTLHAAAGKTLSLRGSLEGGYLPQFGGLGMSKTGAGTLRLSGTNNTYSAPLNLGEGRLLVAHSGALSSSAAAVLTVAEDTVVEVDGASISNRIVTLSGDLQLTDGGDWSFTDGLSIEGDEVAILAAGSTTGAGSSELSSTDPITVVGNELLFEAEGTTTLEVVADWEFDPEGREAVLRIGPSDGEGGTGVVELAGAVTMAAGATGSLSDLSIASGTLELNNADVSAFEEVFIREDASVEVTAGIPLLRNLSGEGDIELNQRDVVVEMSVDRTFYGDVTGGIGSGFEKKGAGILYLSGMLDPYETAITEGTIQLAGGHLGGLTDIFAGGVLRGVGSGEAVEVQDGGVLQLGSDGYGILEVERLELQDNSILEWSPFSWLGSAGTSWPLVQASDGIYNLATAAEPCVIRVNTDTMFDYAATSGIKEFLFLEGSVTFFDAAEYEVVDVSHSPLPGVWSLGPASTGEGLSLFLAPENIYQDWIESFGYTGTDTEPNQDPDGDGLNNGIEFVVGSSPADSEDAQFPTVTTVEINGVNYQHFSFYRKTRSLLTDPRGQVSSDLQQWSDFSQSDFYTREVTAIDAETDLVEQLVYSDLQFYPKRFFRLFAEFEE